MTHKERVLHTVLFELIALSLFVPLAIAFTGEKASHMTLLSVMMSLVAMSWNYVYNILFDNLYGKNRLSRTLSLRIFHGFCFEIGLLVITIPMIMYFLALDFWNAFMLDIGIAIFFLVYAIVFNWCYDLARKHVFKVEYSAN